MFNKFNEFKDSLKTLKEIENKLTDLDMSDASQMLEKLGIDMDQIEEQFEKEHNTIPKITLKYVLDSDNKEPEYAYSTDSGFDLRANEDVTLEPFGRALVPTGLYLDVPERCEVQVRPKSGLAIKRGLSVLNTPGTVDYGYTGEIKVIMFNLSNETQKINKGDKIAQAVICPVAQGNQVELTRVSKIKEKDRNANGFGSTGN
jgi:dUTP pyrophosphatase